MADLPVVLNFNSFFHVERPISSLRRKLIHPSAIAILEIDR